MNCPVCESKVNKLKNDAPKGQTTIKLGSVEEMKLDTKMGMFGI